MSTEAFVTLATNDSYALGALCWAASLKQVATQKRIEILITKDVSDSVQNVLPQYFDSIHVVNVLESLDPKILEALKRPELNVTLTKIYCWKLIQHKKCVFMDADTLVVKNIDELFEKDELSAVPDIGWPDIFNSGVFVFQPSEKTFQELVQLASTENGSFDGGDQGLLNTYFSDWFSKSDKRLSFIYNMTLASTYSYVPAFKKFGQNIKVIHYLGSMKPWHYSYNASTQTLNTCVTKNYPKNFIELWWRVFNSKVYPTIETFNLVGSLTNMSIRASDAAGSTGQDNNRLQAWQQGQIDYLGADSFENIQKQLDASINRGADGGDTQ